MGFKPKEVAEWLAQGASDEEFAETMVQFFLYYNKNKPFNENLTVRDMTNTDADMVGNKIAQMLREILCDGDMCQSAWWKDKNNRLELIRNEIRDYILADTTRKEDFVDFEICCEEDDLDANSEIDEILDDWTEEQCLQYLQVCGA